MSPQLYAKKVLLYHKIKYDVLIAYHDMKKQKPDAEPMYKCLEEFSLPASEVISFGDDVRDIVSSTSAGIDSMGLDWSSRNYNALFRSRSSKSI
jgi:phosphoglycolate phosphatase-like HAD superfamily hydrolase